MNSELPHSPIVVAAPEPRGTSRRRRSVRYRSKTGLLAGVRKLLAGVYRFTLGSNWLVYAVTLAFFTINFSDFLILLHPLDPDNQFLFDSLGVTEFDDRRDGAEAVKRLVGLPIYGIALLFLFIYRHTLLDFATDNRHLLAIILIALITSFYSLFPQEVYSGVVQLITAIVLAVVFSRSLVRARSPIVSLCLTVLVPLALVHLYSLFVLWFMEYDVARMLDSGLRFGGASGNPNHAGAQSVFGIWLALYLLVTPSATRWMRIVAALLLPVFFFSLILSGSATSQLSTAVLLAAFALFYVMSTLKAHWMTPIALGTLLLVISGVGWLFVNYSLDQILSNTASNIGKDATLTGRTELWAIAWDAFLQQPLRGWGYDSHQSVMADRRFKVDFNHYHNGLLDSLVAGGIFYGALVVFNIWLFFSRFFRLFLQQPHTYGLVIPGVLLVVFNLTEYSVFRPLSPYFQIYLTTFCLVYALSADSQVQSTARLPRLRFRSGSSGRRRMRWA